MRWIRVTMGLRMYKDLVHVAVFTTGLAPLIKLH